MTSHIYIWWRFGLTHNFCWESLLDQLWEGDETLPVVFMGSPNSCQPYCIPITQRNGVRAPYHRQNWFGGGIGLLGADAETRDGDDVFETQWKWKVSVYAHVHGGGWGVSSETRRPRRSSQEPDRLQQHHILVTFQLKEWLMKSRLRDKTQPGVLILLACSCCFYRPIKFLLLVWFISLFWFTQIPVIWQPPLSQMCDLLCFHSGDLISVVNSSAQFPQTGWRPARWTVNSLYVTPRHSAFVFILFTSLRRLVVCQHGRGAGVGPCHIPQLAQRNTGRPGTGCI